MPNEPVARPDPGISVGPPAMAASRMPSPAPKPESGGSGWILILLLLAAGGGGGAYYYFVMMSQ